MCTAGSTTSQQEADATTKTRHRSVDAATYEASSSQPISADPVASNSSDASSAFPSSGGLLISGDHSQPRQWSRALEVAPSNSVIDSGQQSKSPVDRLLPTSASLSYYYYGPAVMGSSKNSTTGKTRVARLQRSLTEPETACATEAMTSPEVVVSGTAATAKNDGLELARLSRDDVDEGTAPRGLQPANYVDHNRVEATAGQRQRRTNHAGASEAIISGDKVGNAASLNTERRHSDIVRRSPDDGRPTDGDAPLPPPGEPDARSFMAARQVVAPESAVTPSRSVRSRVDEMVEGRTHDRDHVHSLHPISRRSDETAVKIRDTGAPSNDDDFLPKPAPRYNDDVAPLSDVATASEKPETRGSLVGDVDPETRIDGEGAVAMEESEGSRRLSQDSFNRPDSPMFHQLMDLPRDSVILHNRRRRRRRHNSNCSTSSSSSSCNFLSTSRRSAASGATRCCSVTLGTPLL